jgi:hypothetical protein
MDVSFDEFGTQAAAVQAHTGGHAVAASVAVMYTIVAAAAAAVAYHDVVVALPAFVVHLRDAMYTSKRPATAK